MKDEAVTAGQSGVASSAEGHDPAKEKSVAPAAPAGAGPVPPTASASAAPGTRRPGGRTARTRAAVRDAVLSGLADHGYPGLTVEYVADHSGVHKTTLYRRWGGLEGMVADALEMAGEDTWTPPDTGSLEGDLRELAREVVESFSDEATAAAPTAFVAAAFQSARAADALHAFYAERFGRCEAVVERAVERGEAPPDTDAAALVRAVSAPLLLRVFITREPVDAALADQAAAAAVAATRAGAFERR
ncbi:TetR family transcriptional regulator [Streptomyces sp. SID335]|nr:TetR family transcriptional regulator [Streptomyces sp. SID335]MYZ12018.1 TetR family transcriptional regulator [Streptomyces sp. SID337]NDZ86771.1 TetR/AcrR family transcriptional regulator [Streptomyces sp. SID10115]NEA00272.1 TetR/AcrR family transcriptional regulator [Streptomyces sp. SID10116]NEB50580.1 TetR/AcrR family transcriptional regulator [Streptomyces sp. SID339]